MGKFLFKKSTRRERLTAQRERIQAKKNKRLKRAMNRRHWAHFLPYLGHYKGSIAWVFALILLGGVAEIILPQLVRLVMDVIVPARDFSLLNWIILGGVGLYLIHAIIRYLEKKKVISLSLNLITEIRSDLFNYHLSLPVSFFEKQSSGKLISKLTYSVSMIKLLIETFAYVCIRELITIILIVSAASLIDWRLTLIFLSLTPLFVIYVHRLNRYMSEIAKELQTKNDQIMTILNQTYSSIKLYQIFGNAPKEAKRLDKVLNEDKDFRIRRTLVYSGNLILIGLLTSLIVLAALWYGGRQMIVGELSYGEVTAYIIYLTMLFRPISEFVRASAFLQAGKVGIHSVFSIFEQTQPLPEPRDPITPASMEGGVNFEGVSFTYPTAKKGLKHFSLKVKAGQKVLIIGPTGSGKSTLFNLMLRLYDPDHGRILIDGVDLRKMTKADRKAYFSVIPQDQLHLEDTLLSNILMDFTEEDPGARIDKVMDLTQLIGMDQKLLSREKKFGERLGSGGLGLSRGELQKLALLRAAAKGAPIVLMDEPTSSLDASSRFKLMEAANKLFANKTVFLISHQAQAQFNADWIVILKNGRMENQGSHHYLLAHSEYYRRMYRHRDTYEKSASGT